VVKEYYIDGNLHRLNGPAVDSASGYKAWYQNGKFFMHQPAPDY